MNLTQTHPRKEIGPLVPRVALVLGGSLLIALSAQISVPMYPVPMTLQTLAILIIGMSIGLRLGLATVFTWLAQGAVGLPVFAGGGSTSALFGPTAGFLFGFIIIVAIAGLAADRGIRSVVGLTVVGLVASALLCLPGLAWPAVVLGTSVPDLMEGWMLPFLVGDTLRAVIAGTCVEFAQRVARRMSLTT